MDTGPQQTRLMNPRFKANLLSILTFGWTIETFKLGYRRDIKESDLYAPLPEHRSDMLGDAMQKAWDSEVTKTRHRHNSKPSLLLVLFKVFGPELMFFGLILAAMELLIRLQQPLFLGLLLRYYSPDPDIDKSRSNATYITRLLNYYDTGDNISWGEAVFFAFGIIFCSTVNVMVQHPFMMAVMHMGMKMRVGVCSLIYRKALKVSLQDMTESSAGLVVNLMANDVNRFDTGPLFVHYLWLGPLETVLMTMYLYRDMGISAVYGALVIIGFIPFQIFLGTRTAFYRKETALKTDERVRLMKEIIMGMEVIKMYTWEQPFRKIIDTVRRQEIHFIKMTSYIRGVILSFIMFTSRFGIFITVFLYVTFINRITVENVFFLTCYYNITKQTMTLYFPQAVGQIAEMKVAVQRIRDYLLSEECSLPSRHRPDIKVVGEPQRKRVTILDDPIEMSSQSRPQHRVEAGPSKKKDEKLLDMKDPEPVIKFQNAYSKWIKSSDKNDVENINLIISSGSLTTIIGAVGSGKSTLLQMILRELPCLSGSLEVLGDVSYASQDPWLFVGSVRQNILFGQPFQKSRYMEVCKVCALERDISLFPHGDKTIVGERGVSLSGGQRARINLARAVYKQADIYLLDDPLSAVDTQVAKHIFERCIKKFLSNKTVVLVTHQIQFIKFVDQVVILDKGKILAEGAFEDLNDTELNIIQLMHDKVREVHEDEPGTSLQSTSLIQPSTISVQMRHFSLVFDTSIADQKPEAEYQAVGRVKSSVYKEYFFTAASCPFVFVVCFMFILAQGCASACDYWISRWYWLERPVSFGDIFKIVLRPTSYAMFASPWFSTKTLLGLIAPISHQLYVLWLLNAHCHFNLLICWVMVDELRSFTESNILLSHTEDSLTGDTTMDNIIWKEQGLNRNVFVLVFALITIATVVVALIRSFVFFSLCMRSSIKLHDKMFEVISRSPMSFFNTNSSGRILNRFSKDMGAVDELLPQAMIDCFQILLNLVGVIVVILMTDVTLLIPVTAAIIIFYLFRVIYIRTTSAVKRLEGITRSPVFGHLNATVQGLATVRSFGAEALLAQEFDRHQDLHSSAWYLFITCSRAFGYFLDVICLLFIVCVTFSCLMKSDINSSYVGLAITQSISLTGIFQWGMRQSAEMENQMTSVERVIEYTKLPQESALISDDDNKPPMGWPTAGLIRFNNLSLKYSPEGNYVLHKLQFEILPQEKVGIVGRTGAGKSSIIQALFRLAYLEGSITIDGVDITSIGLHDLRGKLSIIPQEPVLFSGTMRKNLDPFDEYPDEVLLQALKNVELHSDDEGNESLYKIVSEGGSNFSVGERQLVCLARAIVHNDRILVLDEATANVDAQTDALIQMTIREHFKHCTVLTIAHRLNTVIDSDKILVLDAGRLLEYDHPHILLQNKKGHFRRMVAETGRAMAPILHKQAYKSYQKMTS